MENNCFFEAQAPGIHRWDLRFKIIKPNEPIVKINSNKFMLKNTGNTMIVINDVWPLGPGEVFGANSSNDWNLYIDDLKLCFMDENVLRSCDGAGELLPAEPKAALVRFLLKHSAIQKALNQS